MISGAAKIAGILGWPVSGSRSPRLHNYWLNLHDIDGAYVPLPTAPEHLGAATRALLHLGFRGANVTVPHKQAVIAHLDWVDPTALRLQSVNTIVARDGGLWGTSTDGQGFIDSLREAYPTFDLTTCPTVIIGAGGAARAIVGALVDENVPEIRVVNRTVEKIAALARQLDPSAVGSMSHILAANDAAAALDGVGLVINATTQGMAGQAPLDLDLRYLPPQAIVADIVYSPLETNLLKAAAARGNPTLTGIGMLIHQARAGFTHWFGDVPEITDAVRQMMVSPT